MSASERRKRTMKNRKIKFAVAGLVLSFLTATVAFAQTSVFTYQGKLTDTGNPQNGTYQMEFKLFGSAGGADQIGATAANNSVAVAQGVFTAELNFGGAAFDGADRFLEIAVRRTGSDAWTILTPRQKILSAPYSIKSKSSDTAINATRLNDLDSSQFVKFNLDGGVSIGAKGTGSKLTVAGVIESTGGGIKFPDATTQTTAGLTTVATNTTLTGSGTTASPLGVASPLTTRDSDNPARQPFQYSISTGSSGVIAVTVPADKRLVIEFVSGTQSVSNGSGPGIFTATITTQAGNEVFRHYVLPATTVPRGTFTDYYASQPVRMYLSAGQQLRVLFNSDASSSRANVTGYYVDIP
jgi:hypothetical protein